MKTFLCSVAALALSAATAAAVTVDFAFKSGEAVVGSGSFAYADALDGGVIGYGDLDAFSFTIVNTYDLTFIQTGTFGPFVHFAWDSAVDAFEAVDIFGFPTLLAAIDSTLTNGFFVRPPDNIPLVRDYGPNPSGEIDYTVLEITVNREPAPPPVPLPAGALLLVTALAGLGVAARRRKAA